MTVHRMYKTGSFASNMYLIVHGGVAAIVDPSLPYDSLAPYLDASVTVAYCFITHAHFDHFLEVEDIIAHTGARLVVGHRDASALADAVCNCSQLFLGRSLIYRGDVLEANEGDTFRLGDETITVMHTPGHSEGSISLLTKSALFVGDVIFEGGGYGRTDLPGGDLRILSTSIARLLSLSDNLTVYAGHGAPFSLSSYENYL